MVCLAVICFLAVALRPTSSCRIFDQTFDVTSQNGSALYFLFVLPDAKAIVLLDSFKVELQPVNRWTKFTYKVDSNNRVENSFVGISLDDEAFKRYLVPRKVAEETIIATHGVIWTTCEPQFVQGNTQPRSGLPNFELGETSILIGIGLLAALTVLNFTCLMLNIFRRKRRSKRTRSKGNYTFSGNGSLPSRKREAQDSPQIMMAIQECVAQDLSVQKRKGSLVTSMEKETQSQATPNLYESQYSHYQTPRSYD